MEELVLLVPAIAFERRKALALIGANAWRQLQ